MKGTHFKACEVRPGVDTIIERTERGTIDTRYVIVASGPCLDDAGNIHLTEKGGKTMCYFREAKVEIL